MILTPSGASPALHGACGTTRMTERRYAMSKWTEYENEKRRIAATAKSSEEYEKKIRALVKRMGL